MNSLINTPVEKVITDEERQIFEITNFVILCGIVGLFGITANVINILIFYTQGFANTVNIAFLGLAISDLCCLITLEWISTSMNPLLVTSEVPWVIPDVMYLSGAWPHVCFCRITSFITVYITAERCLSIALPMKIKQIITPKKTTLSICLIYIVNLMTLIPEYATSFLGWRSDPEQNMTLVMLIFTSSRKDVDGFCYVIHSMLSTTSFIGVIVFTFVLVNKLRKTSKWRKVATQNNDKRGSMSNRDQKTVKMVVLIAGILIVCYTPGAVVAMATFIVGPEKFSMLRGYVNECSAAWSLACPFQTINSSVNIFLYYRMSSKYRHTFDEFILKYFRSCKSSTL